MNLQLAGVIVSVAAVVVIAIWALGWWLRGQFQQVKDASDARWMTVKDALDEKYDLHERQDQKRHEDNLKQFGRIYVALAQLGWRNGGSPDQGGA